MPWLERTRVVDRIKFMLEWEKRWEEGEGHVNVAELCRDFGVSRKTGYKWRKRWDPTDPSSLEDRSRRRRTYEVGVPSVATIGRILKRRGLVRPPKRRTSKTPRFSAPFEGCNSPNGPPFSSPTVGGLSRLSVWWMRLGIRPERIDPGHPEQNGRHERMHRTLKADTASPPASSMRAQQRRFDEFRAVFNRERPHEALDFETPMSIYERSDKQLPAELPRVDYELGPFVYRLPATGILSWRGENLYISTCLAHQDIALQSIDDQSWKLIFINTELGRIEKNPKGRYRFKRLERVLPMS